MTAMSSNQKVLLTHAHFYRHDLEMGILPSNYLSTGLMDLSDHGIDALSRFLRFNKVQEEDFNNYTTSILKNKLDLLVGSNNKNEKIYKEEFNKVVQLVLQSAKRYYGATFIDLPPEKNPISEAIIAISDIVVISLSQNSNDLEEYFKKPIQCSNIIYGIGRYDPQSKYRISNIKRKYKIKNEVIGIHYDIAYSDALCDGKIINFLLKNYHIDKGDIHYPIVDSLRQLSEKIVDLMER